MNFQEALDALGFRPAIGRTPSGVRVYAAEPNRYMTYTVQAFQEGTALFTWGFAVGEYLATKGIQFGSDETLNQVHVPPPDERGPQDGAWLAGAIERTEAALRGLRFDRPEE